MLVFLGRELLRHGLSVKLRVGKYYLPVQLWLVSQARILYSLGLRLGLRYLSALVYEEQYSCNKSENSKKNLQTQFQ